MPMHRRRHLQRSRRRNRETTDLARRAAGMNCHMDRLYVHDSMKSANHNNVQALAMETAFSMVVQGSVLSTLTPLPLLRYAKYWRSWQRLIWSWISNRWSRCPERVCSHYCIHAVSPLAGR